MDEYFPKTLFQVTYLIVAAPKFEVECQLSNTEKQQFTNSVDVRTEKTVGKSRGAVVTSDRS
jgi:hypothetical protein